MTSLTSTGSFQSSIVLFHSDTQVLVIHKGEAFSQFEGDRRTKCGLTFETSWNEYQHIVQDAHFNCKPEFQGQLEKGALRAGQAVAITIALHPQFLSKIDHELQDIPAIIQFLAQLPGEVEPTPLLEVDNWYLLSAYQVQDGKNVGYRTLWDYLDLTLLDPTATFDPEAAIAGISQFYQTSQFAQDLFQAQGLAGDASTLASIHALTESLIKMGLSGTNGDPTRNQDVSQRLLDVLGSAWNGAATLPTAPTELDAVQGQSSLHTTITQFFQQSNWPIEENQRQDLFRTSFEGENGTWTCYGKILESERRFIFYSVCPLELPEDKLSDVAEFVCRANSGLVLGNFELDFEDRDIRYKTSIDVENSVLDMALVKNLVMANVYIMDEYLPGIVQVLTGAMSPQEAINHIES